MTTLSEQLYAEATDTEQRSIDALTPERSAYWKGVSAGLVRAMILVNQHINTRSEPGPSCPDSTSVV